jgi:GT2 family glycosyltransferase
MSECSRKALVSVVIVSWNARSYLERCLDSLAVHGGQRPLEIIVVDNDSSDGSPELVVERYPHVRLIRSGSNLGFAKANNIGLAASSGDFLLLINSDAEVLPGCIDMLILHLESDASLGMAGPRILGGDGLLQRSCRSFPTLWNMACRALGLDTALGGFKVFSGYSMRYWSQTETRHVDILTGCFWAAKRQAYEDVGGLDEAFFIYGEDMDWCKRFWAKGWKLSFLSTAQAIHHGGGSSRNAPIRFFLEKQKADLQYWRKHHSAPKAFAYLVISIVHMLLRIVGYSLGQIAWTDSASSYKYKVQRSIACLNMLSRAARDEILPRQTANR